MSDSDSDDDDLFADFEKADCESVNVSANLVQDVGEENVKQVCLVTGFVANFGLLATLHSTYLIASPLIPSLPYFHDQAESDDKVKIAWTAPSVSGLKNSSAVGSSSAGAHWYKDAEFENKPDKNKKIAASVWAEPTGGTAMRYSSSVPNDLSSYASPAAARATTLPRVNSVLSVPEVDAAPGFSSVFSFGADGRLKW